MICSRCFKNKHEQNLERRRSPPIKLAPPPAPAPAQQQPQQQEEQDSYIHKTAHPHLVLVDSCNPTV